jgi:hypothetical protein
MKILNKLVSFFSINDEYRNEQGRKLYMKYYYAKTDAEIQSVKNEIINFYGENPSQEWWDSLDNHIKQK